MWFKKKNDIDPTQLAYVEPDPTPPVESPLGAAPFQPSPLPQPAQPAQAPAAPMPTQQPLAAAPVQPPPTQPMTPPPPPAAPPSVFSTAPSANPPAAPNSPGKATQVLKIITFMLLASALSGGAYYGYQYYQKSPKSSALKNIVAAEPTQAPENRKVLGVVDSVRKQVPNLPTDETPTVATVTNLAKLQGQAFFAKAQTGDKVLIYATAKKAYLFRPSTTEIIQESKVEVDGDKSSTATASAETTTSKSGEPVLKIKF